MPRYRVLTISHSGTIARARHFIAGDDNEAIDRAVGDHESTLGLELWRRGELLHEIKPKPVIIASARQ